MAAGEPTTYTGTETVPVPPASNFAGSGGGDGWSVALSNTQVFNVFHHDSILQVVCHNQSDSSVCWGPDTIQDASGNNFATSGHPGMYLDPNTGKLWVYATRESTDPTLNDTGGVVCIDTTQPASNPNPFCGFVALTAAGETSTNCNIGCLSPPMLFGTRLYAFNFDGSTPFVGSENRMLCFDVSTDAGCSGQPFTVNLGAGVVSVSPGTPTPSTALIGNQLIVPINVNTATGSQRELACLDANTNGNCSGSWPASLSGTNYTPGSQGAPFPMLSGSGALNGMCLPDGTDECVGLDGSSQATPPGMQAAIGGGSVSWNGGGLVIGPRVYVPAWSNTVYCYDAATQASCANFPKSLNNLGLLYTVNADPQRPSCIWVNADDGSAQIQNFDAFTAGSCSQGSPRAFISQFVNSGSQCTPNSYVSLHVSTTATVQSVSIEDGDSNLIAQRQPDSNGNVDLSGLNLNTSDQFVINLAPSDTNQPAVTLKLVWTAPYDVSCIDDDDTAANPAITASGANVSATEGQSFTTTVATFKDPDGSGKASDYSASINWGDGHTNSGTITGSPSKFTVTGTYRYDEEGSFPVKVTITDKDSSNGATTSSTGKVADAALHATSLTPSLSGTTVSGKLAKFTDDDPNGALSDYTASINWGDGSTSSGVVTNTDPFVNGRHTYATSGKYTIKITIRDAGGSTASTTVTVSAQVKAASVSARLSGAPACVSGAFVSRVSGNRIASVRFTLDGRRQRTRTVQRGRQYSARIAVSAGRHSLTVRVKFRSGSSARSRTFHRTVRGCALPSFTG